MRPNVQQQALLLLDFFSTLARLRKFGGTLHRLTISLGDRCAWKSTSEWQCKVKPQGIDGSSSCRLCSRGREAVWRVLHQTYDCSCSVSIETHHLVSPSSLPLSTFHPSQNLGRSQLALCGTASVCNVLSTEEMLYQCISFVG